MDTTELRRAGGWRFDQLADLPDDGRRYEVVDGLLVVSPPPSPWHQLIGATLLLQLGAQATPDWRVLYELGVTFGSDGRVPDLAVVSSRYPLRSGPAVPVTPAHVGLVVEVVSPTSRKTDRFAKPGEYADAGIPLFWRVETDPNLRLCSYRLQSGAYVEVGVVDTVGTVTVPWGSATIDLDMVRAAAT